MSLNAPNLDDRKFQDIVDDVKRQIGLRCPEWTDHNVSDPGVTLLELFAWMMEMMLFRLNQVPEKNYLTFLEMLDITLEPPRPASAELMYHLHKPIPEMHGRHKLIPDAFDADARQQIEAGLRELRKTTRRGMVAATRRTETEMAIEFTTEADIEWKQPALLEVLAMAAPPEPGGVPVAARKFPLEVPDKTPLASPLRRFYIFNEPERTDTGEVRKGNTRSPRTDDALYLGFETNLQRHVLRLTIKGVTAVGIGVDPNNPLQRWEVYTGEEPNPWRHVATLHDDTNGFDKDGRIELAMPAKLVRHGVNGTDAYWLRCRYIGKGAYTESPAFTELDVEVIGALVPAANYKILAEETLGYSDGTPGQSFRLMYPPALPLDKDDEFIRIGDTRWERRFHFAESKPDDFHFMCDCITGEIRFGPSIMQPNGATRQYGAIPKKGQKIILSAYRHGGGTEGNVREHQICVDKDNHIFIASVTNPDVATGGHDMENVEQAKMRARAMLQMRHRAVTPEDFEFLALQSKAQVGRAHCLPVRDQERFQLRQAVRRLEAEKKALSTNNYAEGTGQYRLNQERIASLTDRIKELTAAAADDVVCVLIVPAFGANILTPSRAVMQPDNFPQIAREVKDFLDTKRLLTTKVQVIAPDYVEVSITIRVASDPTRNAQQVANRVRDSLNRLVHPLYGGADGTGWPFGRALTTADVYACVGAVEGVAFLTPPILTRHDAIFDVPPDASSAAGEDAQTASELADGSPQAVQDLAGRFLSARPEDNNALTLLPHQLWLTGHHTAEAIPVPFFDMQPGNPHLKTSS